MSSLKRPSQQESRKPAFPTTSVFSLSHAGGHTPNDPQTQTTSVSSKIFATYCMPEVNKSNNPLSITIAAKTKMLVGISIPLWGRFYNNLPDQFYKKNITKNVTKHTHLKGRSHSSKWPQTATNKKTYLYRKALF